MNFEEVTWRTRRSSIRCNYTAFNSYVFKSIRQVSDRLFIGLFTLCRLDFKQTIDIVSLAWRASELPLRSMAMKLIWSWSWFNENSVAPRQIFDPDQTVVAKLINWSLSNKSESVVSYLTRVTIGFCWWICKNVYQYFMATSLFGMWMPILMQPYLLLIIQCLYNYTGIYYT